MKFLLTMPARNEEATIQRVIEDFSAKAHSTGINLQIQVIDDGSTDQTRDIAHRLGIRVFGTTGGPGLANAFRAEMRAALSTDADVFIHVDADGQYLAADLDKLIARLELGYQLILGNRLHVKPDGMSELRFAGNNMLSSVVSQIAGQRLCDTQTGYRVFRRSVAEDCAIKATFTYTQEQIIRASSLSYRICEIPISNRSRSSGTSSRLMRSPFQYLSAVALDLELVVAELHPVLLER